MAIGIDNVYQQVLAIANKEQRGYITPQEFNLFARKAQNDIFEKTFIEYKDAFLNPTSVMQSHKSLGMLREKIAPFRVEDADVYLVAGTGVGTVSQLSSEFINNADMDDDTEWDNGTGWTTSAGFAVPTGTQTEENSLIPDITSSVNEQHCVVTFTVTDADRPNATCEVSLGGNRIGTVTGNGEYEFSGIGGSNTTAKLKFTGSGGAATTLATNDYLYSWNGKISNVSLRKMTGTAVGDVYWIESVYHFDGDNSCVFEEIDKKRVNFLEKYKGQTGFPLNIDHLIFDEENGLKFSTINTYYRKGTDELVFYPVPLAASGEAVQPKCDYIKTIASEVDPKWAFTVVNGKALYDSSNSYDFKIHSSEEGNLINKILEMAGISMNKPDLTQSALQNQATNMQQQVQRSFIDNVDNERTSFVQDQFPYGSKQQPPRR